MEVTLADRAADVYSRGASFTEPRDLFQRPTFVVCGPQLHRALNCAMNLDDSGRSAVAGRFDQAVRHHLLQHEFQTSL
jgi:hypothetical protein